MTVYFRFLVFIFSFFRFFCFLFVFVNIYVPKQIHRRMWLSESRSKYIFFKNPNFRSRINFARKYLEVKSTLYIVTLKIFLLNNISQVYFISHICSTWQGFSTSRFLVDQGFLRRSFTFTSFFSYEMLNTILRIVECTWTLTLTSPLEHFHDFPNVLVTHNF